VDTDGVVTTKALGEVTITATGPETSNCNEARSASYTLNVVETADIKAIDLATPHSLGENGQLTMDNYYDLQGRRIDSNSTRKGVYIVRKKKVVIK
jgi:hypothetical protein